jgi:DNA replication protein DnaC
LVRTLQSTEFTTSAHNAVFIGGPGTGKTHLATAIGVEAIQKYAKRVRFFSTVELVNALEQEKAHGKSGQLAYKLMYVDLVILDELGYLPFSQAAERVNDFATPCFMNLRCRVVLFQSGSFAWAVG